MSRRRETIVDDSQSIRDMLDILMKKIKKGALNRPLTMREIQSRSRKFVEMAPDEGLISEWLSRNARKTGTGQCQVTGMRAKLWQL
jgi:hypothetical protein